MSAERLADIARRLDELAEDGPSELSALSEELGALAEKWPVVRNSEQELPPFLREISRVFEREMAERIYRGDVDPYRIRREIEQERMRLQYMSMATAVVPGDISRFSSP